MTFRPLPTPVPHQDFLRETCCQMQRDNARSTRYMTGYLSQAHDEALAMDVRVSAYHAAKASQGIVRDRSAQERYMRGLDEGLVLDHIGPRCTFCGSCHDVEYIGGSHPYTCGGPRCYCF